MIDRRTIFEIHRLKDMDFSVRQIALQLNLDRATISKYIKQPSINAKPRQKRPSKLDPFKELIKEMVEQYTKVKAPVILRIIREKGFDGEITIVRKLLRQLKYDTQPEKVFIRFESNPGQQMQIDWGHFGSLAYGNSTRKLYALVVITLRSHVESHSRMMFVVFTHSQNQATLHQCLVKAFIFFNGTSKEIVVDNMLTAVNERVGSIIRFNDSFLDFLRNFSITPVACNVRAPHEKV